MRFTNILSGIFEGKMSYKIQVNSKDRCAEAVQELRVEAIPAIKAGAYLEESEISFNCNVLGDEEAVKLFIFRTERHDNKRRRVVHNACSIVFKSRAEAASVLRALTEALEEDMKINP
jgi:hypothetical protein